MLRSLVGSEMCIRDSACCQCDNGLSCVHLSVGFHPCVVLNPRTWLTCALLVCLQQQIFSQLLSIAYCQTAGVPNIFPITGLPSVPYSPLKPGVIMWLDFECSAPYRFDLSILISDIRALWRSGLSARVPECQKLKMTGQTCMAKCSSLKNWSLKD